MSDRFMGSISIAATFTAEPLSPSLPFILEQAGLPLDIHFAPYNQLFQQLLSESELLARNTKGINVILIRVEDFVRDASDENAVLDIVARTTRELKAALSSFAQRAKVPSIVSILELSERSSPAFRSELESAGFELERWVGTLPGMIVLLAEDIDRVSSGARYDPISDELAHIPYTAEQYSSIAIAIARKVHAAIVPAHKVLVLDCDNTIWRGVVGEDGVDGVVISQAFASLQKFAVDAHLKGVLICLASKNAERDVLEVFEKRPDMILKLDHVVAHRINWDPKPQNIRALAQALNLGLDSIVFLDDNPVECAMLRAELPQVVTLQVPAEADLELFLSNIWVFDKISITDEDARRTQMYKENSARQQLEESTADIGDFIASLEVVIDINSPAQTEWSRLSQLTQRTNQFNFSTVRRTEPELRALAKDGATILRVNVKDRFGDYGLVGLVIACDEPDRLVVDTLLLSCRVLGRGVEHAILRKLGDIAKARKLSVVAVPFVPTSKNEPAWAFIKSVASSYRREESGRSVFAIPSEVASATTHRPGHDPEEVINASKSVDKAGSSEGGAVAIADRSTRYTLLAEHFTTGDALNAAVKSQLVRKRSLPGKAAQPTSDIERRMLLLWEEVLAIRDLGIDDDYFAAGGSSLAAATMFAEISRRFGIKLPLTTILTSPTVRLLAREVGGNPTSLAHGLLELKRGTGRNVFLVHDGDGETLLYANLARRLPDDVAVFGVNPHSLGNIPLAHASIEQMAECYVAEICGKQPHGPYFLGGMCAGGVIALEMANQLISRGETVQLVALLDAAAPRASRHSWRNTKLRFGRLSREFAESREISPTQQVLRIVGSTFKKAGRFLRWELTSRLKEWSVSIRFQLFKRLVARGRAWPVRIPALSVRQIYESAEASHVPKASLATKVVLIRATRGEGGDTPFAEIYSDPALGWATIAPSLALVDVNGGHFTMLQEPAVEHLASVLCAVLVPEPDPQPFGDVERPALS